jgi:protein-tyrosine phosphatase
MPADFVASTMRVLLVCTANQCRSPMAAALLIARLAGASRDMDVGSAGFGSPGFPAVSGAVLVMARMGTDLSDHRSRLVTAELCRRSDLTLAMTAQQLVDLVVLDPPSWSRTFTLRDFVRRADAIGPLSPDGDPGAWVRRAHGGRSRAGVLAAGRGDDIADPTGLSDRAFERTRDELDGLVTSLARHLL